MEIYHYNIPISFLFYCFVICYERRNTGSCLETHMVSGLRKDSPEDSRLTDDKIEFNLH